MVNRNSFIFKLKLLLYLQVAVTLAQLPASDQQDQFEEILQKEEKENAYMTKSDHWLGIEQPQQQKKMKSNDESCYDCLNMNGRCLCCCSQYPACVDSWHPVCSCRLFPFMKKCLSVFFEGNYTGYCPYDCIGKDFNKGEVCGCDFIGGEGCSCRFTEGTKNHIKNWLDKMDQKYLNTSQLATSEKNSDKNEKVNTGFLKEKIIKTQIEIK